MADLDGRGNRRVKRRIAATAATAALALSGPAAAAARPATPRSPQSPRPGGDPVSLLAHSDQSAAANSLDVARRDEMAAHRTRLADALAAELGASDAGSIEAALASADDEMSAAYARGERPRFVAGVPAALTDGTGIGEDELTAAFESMSRNALARLRGTGN